MNDSYDYPEDEPETRDDSAAPAGSPSQAAELLFPTLDDFVREHLRFKYRRLVGRAGRADLRWKAAWWESEEATSRLECMWRGWERARQDPLGMSDWWLNTCDPHMTVLLSPFGPFATSQDENKPGDALPYAPPPSTFFPPKDAGGAALTGPAATT